ncbi:class I adenylate-forming enzyme family protein [Nocardia puris]|uniref:Acyl-CoA synthetase (AMP-forming)/AMP-acid ligase II n=1 Tax=Nocardia puris TaxID=208602 RepID=A0A366E2H5_9NOCA|nr:AMP-binding protein [Nocardia puris]RBO96497.1 acyl-CoA synthetase (AMP-forming)/AMP-acid ligase II [Nocardia puris]
MPLADLPGTRRRQNPGAPCLSDDDVTLTAAQFDERVRRAAAALRSHGVGPGDVVAVMLPNTVTLVVTLFAAWYTGAALTPVNPALTNAEVDYQLTDAHAKVLVTDSTYASGDTIVVSPAELLHPEPVATEPVRVGDAEPALLIYTSGTTGRPKGVVLDHANLNAMCAMMIDALGLSAADHSLLVLPLFHVNGIVVSTLSPLLAGGRTTIAGRFSPKTFFDRLVTSGATYFSAVPTIYTMLADLPPQVRPDTSRVRFGICGAAPASVELIEKFESRYGITIVEGYGLSEGTCASTLNPVAGLRKPGTVGRPLPGQRVRIADETGAPVPDGEAGEVLIQGPNVMRGYLNRPAETAKTLAGGWLHTGDIGYLDADGYLVLVDRAKDMIIRGGENIYPKEIENVVYQLPEVAEAAVVGRPSALYGEEPVLFVALNSGADLPPERILAHVGARMSKYKLPVDVTVLDELPKNAVGKLDKPSLRRALVTADAV